VRRLPHMASERPAYTLKLHGKEKIAVLTMAYSIIGIKKLHTVQELGAASAHNERTRETRNADPVRRQDNERLRGSGDLCADVQARLDAAGIVKVRSNGVRAVEHMLTASPEWFQAASPERVREWVDRSMSFLHGRYGNNLVSAHLHMDETSPQIHAVVVPITPDGRLSAKEYFGTPAKLRALHTDYSQAMEPLGLQRGTERSTATHMELQDYYHRIGLPTKEAWEAARDITIAPLPPGVSMEEHLAATIAQALTADKQRAQYWEQRATRVEGQLQGERMTRERHEMSAEQYGQLVNRVRDTDLTEVMQGLGATPDRYDRHKWHLGEKEINIRGQKYYDFHAPASDPMARRGGAIDLVQYATGKSFADAVDYLNHRHHGGRALDIPTPAPAPTPRAYVQPEPGAAQLPADAPDRWPEVRRYLIRDRHLPADLVDEAHGRGDVYASEYKGYPNATFVRRDQDGQAVGSFTRGTRGMFRQSTTREGCDGYFSVEYGTPRPGEPPSLAVVESPIDALSYVALHRDGPGYGRVVSTDGRGPLPTRQIEEAIAQGGTVRAGFDNDGPDGGGAQLWQQVRDTYPTETNGDFTPIMREKPQGKDWNEDLEQEQYLPSAERSKDTPSLDRDGPNMGR